MACIIPFPARPAPASRPLPNGQADPAREALVAKLRAILCEATSPAPAPAAPAVQKADASTVGILWRRMAELERRVKDLEEKFSPSSHPRGGRRAAGSSSSIQPA